MGSEQGFLSDIAANPGDDAPRLVYADWLEDHGQAELGAFSRVQIELDQIDPTDERYPELHLRQLQLLAEHEREWLGSWTERLVRWRFHRGLLHEVTLSPEAFISHGADLFARHPVHTVAFVNDEGESLAAEAIGRVLAAPHFALVRGLERSGCRPVLPRLTRFAIGKGEGFATWLLSSAPLTARMSQLHLNSQEGGDPLVEALAESGWAQGVCHLDFSYNDLTPQKVIRLASAPFARHLEALHLGSERGEETLEALEILADDRNFPRLRDLVVGSETIEGGIEVLKRRFGSRLRIWQDY